MQRSIGRIIQGLATHSGSGNVEFRQRARHSEGRKWKWDWCFSNARHHTLADTLILWGHANKTRNSGIKNKVVEPSNSSATFDNYIHSPQALAFFLNVHLPFHAIFLFLSPLTHTLPLIESLADTDTLLWSLTFETPYRSNRWLSACPTHWQADQSCEKISQQEKRSVLSYDSVDTTGEPKSGTSWIDTSLDYYLCEE